MKFEIKSINDTMTLSLENEAGWYAVYGEARGVKTPLIRLFVEDGKLGLTRVYCDETISEYLQTDPKDLNKCSKRIKDV